MNLEYDVRVEEGSEEYGLCVYARNGQVCAARVGGSVNRDGIIINGCTIKTRILGEGIGTRTIIQLLRETKKLGRERGFDPKWAYVYSQIGVDEEIDVVIDLDKALQKIGFHTRTIFRDENRTLPKTDEVYERLQNSCPRGLCGIIDWYARIDDVIQ